MSISTPFIHRPVATTLLLVALTLGGSIAYTLLPVSALPEVDFPTISVFANLPGASPDVMAAAVATPLEKQFTRIAGITEMTSRSSVGSAQVTLQFDLNRDINAAAREVQAAINSSAGFLPSNLPSTAEVPQDQSGGPAHPSHDARVGRRAPAAALRHRLLGIRAETFAGERRGPSAGRRQFAAGRSRGSESAAALPLQRGSRSDRHVPAKRQRQSAQRLACQRSDHSFRSTPPISFSWRRTTEIWWWSTATARRSACRTWAA